MKVFHLIARVNRGGTANWIENLVIGLRNLGHTVELFAGVVEANEIEHRCFTELEGRRMESLKRTPSIFSDFRAIVEFRKILKAENPEVLNTHTAKAGLIGRIAAIGLPVKTVHTFHGHVLYGYFNPISSRIFLSIERILAALTDVFIAVGEKVKSELIEARIGNPDIYISISPAVRKLTKISEHVAREKLDLPQNQFTVGWLGRFAQIKRPDKLIEIALRNPGINFIMGGEGELLTQIKEISPKNVFFTGWANPEVFWSACNIAILTSDNEGLPTSLIEAGSFGLPIITTNVGSASEIVKDKESGFVIENIEDADSFIRNLSADGNLRRKMGTNSQDYCLTKFNLDLFIQSHISAYKM